MPNRLTRIYTRTGDDGTTGLADGRRVPKDSVRIETIGCIDELNSLMGMLIAQEVPENIKGILTGVQHNLFDLGGELAMPGYQALAGESVTRLEEQLDHLNADLPPLQEFILPGGSPQAATCHYARALCRRAERRLLHLSRQEAEEVNEQALKYLNRLSDLLFVTARHLARLDGGNEVYWKNPRREQSHQ